jgi:hypothetical protein
LPNGARYRASSRFGQSFPARARITVAEAVRRALDHVEHATFCRPAAEEDEPVDFKLELMVGVDVSDVFHFGEGGQKPGPDPERASYNSFLSFSDPEGNGWLVQEVRDQQPRT